MADIDARKGMPSVELTREEFERRFRTMEQHARTRGLTLRELGADAWDSLWNEAKAAEKSSEKSADPDVQ